MELLARVFLSKGRMARGSWLLALLGLGVMCVAFGLLSHEIIGEGGEALTAIIFLWGAIALSAQRLHDIGSSGANMLLVLIPVAGPVWLLLLLAKRGGEGPNRYGPDPLTRFDYLRVDISREGPPCQL